MSGKRFDRAVGVAAVLAAAIAAVPVVFADAVAPAVFADAVAPVVFADAVAPAVFADAVAPAESADASAPAVFAAVGAPVVFAVAAAPTAESPCFPEVGLVAAPRLLLLGEAIDVTMTVRAICPGERIPVHLVLVLDGSDAMEGRLGREMRDTMREILDRLVFESTIPDQVGVVAFAGSAVEVCSLTADRTRVARCIDRVGSNGAHRLDLGIRAGLATLRRGRDNDPASPPIEVMLVVAGAPNDTGCPLVLASSNRAKGDGVLLMTVCAGRDCGEDCLRVAAASGRYFFRLEDKLGILSVFDRPRDHVRAQPPRRFTVRAELPPDVSLVPESEIPPPAPEPGAPGTVLWSIDQPPYDGITLTYQVRPLRPGYYRVAGATGELTDARKRTRSFVFPDAWGTTLQAYRAPHR